MTATLQPGQVVRVTNWPGTRGRRFAVVRVDGEEVLAVDTDRRCWRTFGAGAAYAVDRSATAAWAERRGA